MDERVFARYMSDLAYFLTLFENNPSEKYHLPVALAYLKLSKFEECSSVCLEGLKRFPTHCPTKTLLAEAYINLGKISQARELLHDVVAEDDGNYKALKLLGIVMQAEDLSDRAVRYFRLAYFKAPEDSSLVRSITELGGDIDFDKIIEEQSKQVGKRVEEVDEDTKTYNEINQSIKNAEIMMQELFDSNINVNQAGSTELDEALLDNLIQQTVVKAEKKKSGVVDDIVISGSKDTLHEGGDDEVESITLSPIVSSANQTATVESEPDPLVAELSEIIIEEDKEDEKRSEESTNDLIKELSNIGFADNKSVDFTIPTDVDGVGIDSKTGDVVVDLYNVSDTDDPLDDIVVKSDIIADDIKDLVTDIQIDDTDKIIDEVDKLVEETDKEIVSQLELELEDNIDSDVTTNDDKEIINDNEEIVNNNKDDVSEDFFVKELATKGTEYTNFLADEDEVTPVADETQEDKPFELDSEEGSLERVENNLGIEESSEVSKLKDIEKYYATLIGEETFFNINESESSIPKKDIGESASFHQSDIFDEILEKSNITVNDMISKYKDPLEDDKRKKTINKLEKKLEKIRKRKGKKVQGSI